MLFRLEIDLSERTIAAIHILCGAKANPDTGALAEILKELRTMSAQLDALQAAVTAEDTVIDSAVTLIQGIPALIAAAGTDPVALKTLTDDITAKSQALAAAVTANTPAATPAP